MSKGGVWGGVGSQNDSSCPTDRSPLGVEARDEPLSMLSEPELWCCCSEPTLDVMVDEDVDEERIFSLKSVMITVTFPTVIANCSAVLRSMFFSLGLSGWPEKNKQAHVKSQNDQPQSMSGCCTINGTIYQVTHTDSDVHQECEWVFRVKIYICESFEVSHIL